MTIIPILETYSKHLQTLGKSVHTVKAYTHDLAGFAQWLAQTTGDAFDPQAIGPRDIAEYRSYLLTRGKKPATVNRRLVALQRFYKWALKQGHTTNNPFEVLEGVRVKQQQGYRPQVVGFTSTDGPLARRAQRQKSARPGADRADDENRSARLRTR
jgi:site-specific recombinase XerD